MKKAQKPEQKSENKPTPFYAKKLPKGTAVKTGVRAGYEPNQKQEEGNKRPS